MSTSYPHLNPDEPWITITVGADGSLAVKMFGIDRDVPADLLHADHMGRLQDYLYDLFAQPYSVEIIEANGTVSRGLVDQRDKPKQVGVMQWAGADLGAAPEPEPEPEPEYANSPVDPAWGPPEEDTVPRHLQRTDDVMVLEDGFIPGEPIAVAYIAGDVPAASNGQAHVLLSRKLLADLPSGEVVLFGRQSGTAAVCKPLAPL
ncbi:MAG: hypothetical protein FWG11_08810 [Promicromonosporaceae bacterium]|nr:hypothetical protein [Promicromonosporaceae bacterium]